MTKILRIPSLQHLSRNWDSSPAVICKRLVHLANNPPFFNYNPLYSASVDLLLLKQPYEQVVKGIERAVKREKVRQNFLEVLPLLRSHFESISPNYVQRVQPRYYPAGRGLLIPFTPPFIYGVDGKIFFPWLSFWRSNPLSGKQLALFVTLVRHVLSEDPDLDQSSFDILDFSAPTPKEARVLKVLDTSKLQDLTAGEVTEMLEIFAEGFILAQAQLTQVGATSTKVPDDEISDSRQPDLFAS